MFSIFSKTKEVPGWDVAKPQTINHFTVTGQNEAGADLRFSQGRVGFDTTLSSLLCKSCVSYANSYFFSISSIIKLRRFI